MLASLLVAGSLLYGQAQAPPADELASTVRRLVRELDAPQKARRDEAEQELLQLGAKALELLPETNKRTPAEVVLRLDRVRSQLERTQAEAAVQATTVTFSGQQVPVSEVFAAIEQQTGNKVVDFREEFGQGTTDPKVDVSFDKTPFWSALDQVIDQAGLTVYTYGAKDGVAIVGRSESQLPRHDRANYVGSFRMEGIELTARRDLRDPNAHTLELVLEASWEPRLRPITIMLPTDALVATDENGQSIEVAGGMGDAPQYEVQPDTEAISLPLHLAAPQRGVARISSLKGKLSVLLPGRMESFRFENLHKAKRVEQRRAGVTVVLDEVRKNNEVWEVRIRVIYDQASGALESHRGWIFNNEAYLEETRGGEKVEYATLETTRQTEDEVGVAYLFDLPNGPKGYTFVYKTPAAIVSMPVEFELKDLELP